MNSLKKLLPFAVVGVLSGATTLVLLNILIIITETTAIFLISTKLKIMRNLQELALQMEKIL
jgi:hypothetical protein